MLKARFSFGVCSYRGSIYVVGGLDRVAEPDLGQQIPEPLRQCEVYQPWQDRWDRLPSLVEGRINPSLTVVEDQLYCIGGFGNSTMIQYLNLRDL